tara:strand:- start:65 stop:577 length:513 start_codon:yes stop_codon:yes gene_type:complete
MNTNSGVIDYELTPYGENIEGYYSMADAEYETIIDSGFVSPTGIDLYENYLLVSDYSNGHIIIYDLENDTGIQETARLQTGMSEDVMGIKAGPDGSIWFVCTNSSKLYQMLPPMDGDLNGDNSLTLADLIMLLSHIVGSSLLEQEYHSLADIDSNGDIDIFDLILIMDSM